MSKQSFRNAKRLRRTHAKKRPEIPGRFDHPAWSRFLEVQTTAMEREADVRKLSLPHFGHPLWFAHTEHTENAASNVENYPRRGPIWRLILSAFSARFRMDIAQPTEIGCISSRAGKSTACMRVTGAAGED